MTVGAFNLSYDDDDCIFVFYVKGLIELYKREDIPAEYFDLDVVSITIVPETKDSKTCVFMHVA
jgi:hypothetical protein